MGMPNPKILLVEDDRQLADALQAYLSLKNYEVISAFTAAQAFDFINSKPCDLVILDLTLPDEDGLVLLRKIRDKVEVPIIISSGRNDSSDRIAGLEFGADDYLGKPYATRELELRIEHLLKQSSMRQPVKKTAIAIGSNTLDLSQKVLIDSQNKHISLTPSEFSILHCLGRHPGRVFSREQLIDEMRAFDGPENPTAVDICICRLRKKVDVSGEQSSVIATVKGFGYRLSTQ